MVRCKASCPPVIQDANAMGAIANDSLVYRRVRTLTMDYELRMK